MAVYDEFYFFLNKQILLSSIDILPMNGSDKALELMPKTAALLGPKG